MLRVILTALLAVSAADAFAFHGQRLSQSFAARRSAQLSMNVENIATKENVKVGVIGTYDFNKFYQYAS